MSYLKVPTIARRFTATAAGLMEVVIMDYEGPFPEISRTVGERNLETRHATRMLLVRYIGIFAVRVRLYLIGAPISRRILFER